MLDGDCGSLNSSIIAG